MKKFYELKNLREGLKIDRARLYRIFDKKFSDISEDDVNFLRTLSDRFFNVQDANKDEQVFIVLAMTTIDHLVGLKMKSCW